MPLKRGTTLPDSERPWQDCSVEGCMQRGTVHYAGLPWDEKQGRLLCDSHYLNELGKDRHQRWVEAGRPSAEDSIAKMRAIISAPSKFRRVGSFQPIGAMIEREPGSDDE